MRTLEKLSITYIVWDIWDIMYKVYPSKHTLSKAQTTQMKKLKYFTVTLHWPSIFWSTLSLGCNVSSCCRPLALPVVVPLLWSSPRRTIGLSTSTMSQPLTIHFEPEGMPQKILLGFVRTLWDSSAGSIPLGASFSTSSLQATESLNTWMCRKISKTKYSNQVVTGRG